MDYTTTCVQCQGSAPATTLHEDGVCISCRPVVLAYPGCTPRCRFTGDGGRHYLPCPVAVAIEEAPTL